MLCKNIKIVLVIRRMCCTLVIFWAKYFYQVEL